LTQSRIGITRGTSEMLALGGGARVSVPEHTLLQIIGHRYRYRPLAADEGWVGGWVGLTMALRSLQPSIPDNKPVTPYLVACCQFNEGGSPNASANK
jgi:hypothetical protein